MGLPLKDKHELKEYKQSWNGTTQGFYHQNAINQTIQNITQYTQKGLATSDQFLQLSRLQLQQNFETYDLAVDQLIANAVEQVFFLAKDKSIQIRVDDEALLGDEAQDEEDAWINGNGELLERALINLLGNAIKYSDANTTITVTLASHKDHVTIDIEDQGHGIPEDEVDLIFDPYFRSSQQVLAENSGAGLGLRFVKTVIDRHRGSIEVNSEWGRGTTFRLELPRARGQ